MRPNTIFISVIFSSLILCLVSCGSQKNSAANENATTQDQNKVANSKPILTDKKDEQEKPSVKGFAHVPPSSWNESEATSGDNTLSRTTFKKSDSSDLLSVTSIGLPAKNKAAADLVKTCETDFAQGMAKHPEMTREWISAGFSISRFADKETGNVLVWCVSEKCKVQLKFTFGPGGNFPEQVNTADSSTDEFFKKNPTGGAKL